METRTPAELAAMKAWLSDPGACGLELTPWQVDWALQLMQVSDRELWLYLSVHAYR